MKATLSPKVRALIRRQLTALAGGNRLGNIGNKARSKPPRAISLAPIRCLQRNDDEAKV
jgi:hypothetical protein